MHRTNNSSEGWHNRFRLVVGKHHPDVYSAVTEIQKEQAFTETCIAELALGKKIKASPKRKWLELQTRIQNVSREYDSYKNRNATLDYLRTIAHNINL